MSGTGEGGGEQEGPHPSLKETSTQQAFHEHPLPHTSAAALPHLSRSAPTSFLFCSPTCHLAAPSAHQDLINMLLIMTPVLLIGPRILFNPACFCIARPGRTWPMFPLMFYNSGTQGTAANFMVEQVVCLVTPSRFPARNVVSIVVLGNAS